MTDQTSDRVFQLNAEDLEAPEASGGIDRRAFMMRSAVAGAAAVIVGASQNEVEAGAMPLAPTSRSSRRAKPR